MRTSKRQLTLALCSALTLLTSSACDLVPEKDIEVGDGESLQDKVIDTATKVLQGSGSLELRMVEAGAIAARALDIPTDIASQAELTVTAIAVRRCLTQAELDQQKPEDPERTETPDDTQAEASSEATEEEAAAEAAAVQARKDAKRPTKDGSDRADRDPFASDQAQPSPDDLDERVDAPKPEDLPDDADQKQEDASDEVEAPDDRDDDTVASDEELAEEGDRPDACAQAQWIVLKQDDLKIDLLNLHNMDAGGLLAKGELPVGTYRGIRLRISDAKVTVGDHNVQLFIPSGKSAGLKIRAGFEVQDQGQVEIDLGFDLEGSLRRHRKHGWLLKPVLKAKKR